MGLGLRWGGKGWPGVDAAASLSRYLEAAGRPHEPDGDAIYRLASASLQEAVGLGHEYGNLIRQRECAHRRAAKNAAVGSRARASTPTLAP